MEKQLDFDPEKNEYIQKLSFLEKSPNDAVAYSEFTEDKVLENHILAESFKLNGMDIDKIENSTEKL